MANSYSSIFQNRMRNQKCKNKVRCLYKGTTVVQIYILMIFNVKKI